MDTIEFTFFSMWMTYLLLVVQEAINHLISNLNKAFLLKDLRHMNYFLGIQVSTLSDGNIHRSQRKYITDLLPRAKMQYAISVLQLCSADKN